MKYLVFEIDRSDGSMKAWRSVAERRRYPYKKSWDAVHALYGMIESAEW
jgi:hypothetical protein